MHEVCIPNNGSACEWCFGPELGLSTTSLHARCMEEKRPVRRPEPLVSVLPSFAYPCICHTRAVFSVVGAHPSFSSPGSYYT